MNESVVKLETVKSFHFIRKGRGGNTACGAELIYFISWKTPDMSRV